MNFTHIATVAALLSVLAPGPGVQAAQRTFVASDGVDTNPCSIIAPCRSFTAAMAAVDPSGEVVVLDSAGYGSFTVTKSVSVIAPPGVYAGISVFAATDGVVVNAPGARVALRGLTINGQGGNRGIVVTDAAAVNVDGCVISNVASSGIRVDTTGTVHVTNVVVASAGGHGIEVNNGSVTIERVEVRNAAIYGIAINRGDVYARDTLVASSAGTGVRAEPGSGNTAKVTLERVMIARSGTEGIVVVDFGGSTATAAVLDTVVSDNLTFNGIATQGAGATVQVSHSAVSRGAGFGFVQFSGTFESTGDNLLRGNASGPTSGTITAIGYN